MKIENKKILFPLLHVILSFILSWFYIKPLDILIGTELKAYTYFETGLNMAEDKLSKTLCFCYSHILAIILIFLLWISVFNILEHIKKKDVMALLLICLYILGGLFIIFSYPNNFLYQIDCGHNFAYAMAYMPVYWHNFFTNVYFCACMIVIPSSIGITFITYIICITSFVYVIENLFVSSCCKDKKIEYFIVISLILLLFPEPLNMMFSPCRNNIYAILTFITFCLLLIDIKNNSVLTFNKLILYIILFSLLGSWRGEGMIYLLMSPIILFLIFHKKVRITWGGYYKHYIKLFLISLLVLIIFFAPDKYGSNKYHQLDYKIINTPGALMSIFNDKNNNLNYKGADDDLKNIDNVIEIDYIKNYGELTFHAWNYTHGRTNNRQLAAPYDKCKKYLKSTYSICLHNAIIYLKHQYNNYAIANRLKILKFNIAKPLISDDASTKEFLETVNFSDEAMKEWNFGVHIFDVGREKIKSDAITIIHPSLDKYIKKLCDYLFKATQKVEFFISGFLKVIITLYLIFCFFNYCIKKRFDLAILIFVNVGVLVGVALMAPSTFSYYYYGIYIVQYLLLLNDLINIRKVGINAKGK